MESRSDAAVIIVDPHIVADAVCSPETEDAGAVQQTVTDDVGQHSLGVVK